ncbi:MAG: CAP domain-containing protein [Candidatus Saccharibacteria bacterium]|nr:CAP domain-containing protein [Candidatus Saccharibacteria bacterium]
MKRAIIITAILALVAGAGGGVWLKTQLDSQTAAKAAQEQAQSKPEPEPSKYDVGPPDPAEMWELTNEERRKAGLPPMTLDPRLNASAQEKANDMAVRDYYGHESPEGTQGYLLVYKHTQQRCRGAGENLAKLFESGGTSREAVDGWLTSTKGHREAILSDRYDSIGFGLSKDKHGLYLVVQHFCAVKW